MKLYLLIALLILSCKTSNKYNPGDCIQTPDMTIWKVSRIEGGNYIASMRQGSNWGVDKKLSYGTLDDSSKFEISCPMNTVERENLPETNKKLEVQKIKMH
jgi:hypothetical protein